MVKAETPAPAAPGASVADLLARVACSGGFYLASLTPDERRRTWKRAGWACLAVLPFAWLSFNGYWPADPSNPTSFWQAFCFVGLLAIGGVLAIMLARLTEDSEVRDAKLLSPSGGPIVNPLSIFVRFAGLVSLVAAIAVAVGYGTRWLFGDFTAGCAGAVVTIVGIRLVMTCWRLLLGVAVIVLLLFAFDYGYCFLFGDFALGTETIVTIAGLLFLLGIALQSFVVELAAMVLDGIDAWSNLTKRKR